MARKTSITHTYKLKITLPDGVNGAEMLEYLRDAIISHKGGLPTDARVRNLTEDSFTVSLAEKVVKYA